MSFHEGQPRTARAVDVPWHPFRPAADVFLALDFDALGRAVNAAINAEYRTWRAGVPMADRPDVFVKRVGHLVVDAERRFPGSYGEMFVGRTYRV